MGKTNEFINARPVEQAVLLLGDKNDPRIQRMREFALRITAAKKESADSMKMAALNFTGTIMGGAVATALNLLNRNQNSPEISILMTGFAAGLYALSIYNCFNTFKYLNKGALARGEVQSLTTVLASELITDNPRLER